MFSVIMPAYNAAQHILKSIDSILSQTETDFEVLVVDDGSTDNTKEQVESIADERVRYIYQSNGGVSSARNTGILSAKGEYVCFLDADDLWKPNHLSTISNLVNKYPTADVFLTGHEIRLHDGQVMKKVCSNVDNDLQSDNIFKQIWENGYFIHTNSIVCKKTAFDTVGLFELGVKNGEDDDMWYRLFSYFSVAISKEITTTYIRENSTATVSRIFVKDWIFLNRVEAIMASDAVSEDKKAYLCRLLAQRKLSFVRYCILNGEKRAAWKQMKEIDKRLINKKKYVETLVALLLPSAVSSLAVRNRDTKYYRS